MTTIAEFTVKKPDGSDLDLSEKLGKVLLVVNTASKCGFTPQYDGLEELHQKFGDQGFEVLAFPCNQFGGQEPGSAAQIKAFAREKYGAKFPLFEKTTVNGASASPLYKHLKESAPESGLLAMAGSEIKWNFAKFLLDKDGKTIARYAPTSSPFSIEGDIIKAL